jgi:arsenate reductase-like glutaredoxin family protein
MQQFKFPDEQAQKPDQTEKEFELELEDDGSSEPEIEVVDDTPPEDRNRKPLDKEVEEPTEDELNEYSAKVQKRLKELTHARHDERRKAEALAREKAELERVAKVMAEENKRLQEYVSVGTNAYIDKSKSLAEVGLNNARAKLKAALDVGDTDAAVAAQEELYKAQFEMQQVQNFKPVELRKNDNVEYTQQQPAQPTQQAPQLDDRVVSWAEKNPWFERPGDEDMTGYAYGVHNKLVRQYGEAYTRTDEYYHKIDDAMRKAFPEKFDDVEVDTEEPKQVSRPKSVVAPAQRTSAPKKIRLTKTQQNVAKKLGIPLELYAKKMAELENQNG